MPVRKRILVVDDHPLTRSGLVHLLNQDRELTVCAEAESAQQALAALKTARADLVLTDLTMPGKSGLEFIKEAQTLHPGVFVLVLSMHDENVYAERALRAGARGYIMKSEGGEKVLEAIRQVLDGEIYLSKRLSSTLLKSLSHQHPKREDTNLNMLTSREFEVLELIGQGLGTRQIGLRLHISGKTVETHRMHIRAKLGLKAGAELVSYAVRWAAANQLI